MAAAQNTIKYTFADDSSIHATVNGQEVVSAVSGQKLDRTLYGGYRSVAFTSPNFSTPAQSPGLNPIAQP